MDVRTTGWIAVWAEAWMRMYMVVRIVTCMRGRVQVRSRIGMAAQADV